MMGRLDWIIWFIVFLKISVRNGFGKDDLYPPPCDSTIFCHGQLLHTVQMSGALNGQKQFVDMSLKTTPFEAETAFRKLMDSTKGSPSKAQVKSFVEEYFNEPGSAFVKWHPEDWQNNPPFLQKVKDPVLRKWGEEIHNIWKELGRKISDDVRLNQDRYSLIYVKNPFIIPGGLFREFYYWDTYWVLEGLLLSNMTQTVKGMLQNFLSMVEQFGMVPNGGRVYYTRRSQPPYLIPMVKLYVDTTGDVEFLRENIHILQSEFDFWTNHRSVNVTDRMGKVHQVARYNVKSSGPRPETYKGDFTLAMTLKDGDERQTLYKNIQSACESGWDFSTRWFRDVEGLTSTSGDLSRLITSSIVPVDLNSMLCYNARVLSDFYALVGNRNMSEYYQQLGDLKEEGLEMLFWHEDDGIWYDFDLETNKSRQFFYLSNIYPVWTNCFGSYQRKLSRGRGRLITKRRFSRESQSPLWESKIKRGTIGMNKKIKLDKVIDYFKKSEVFNHPGGVPTSVKESQQWDYPGAWAPLQHHLIMSFYNYRYMHPEAESIALFLADKWIKTNYVAYNRTHFMFEKYNVEKLGESGSGEHWKAVKGFGWTNGAVIKLLDTFGDRLTADEGLFGSVVPHLESLMAFRFMFHYFM